MLKAIKPEVVKPSKPKFLLSGKSGVGKTFFSISFPRPYFIDTEGGAVREQYMEKLLKNEGAYFGKEQGSQDFNVVIEEIKQLATSQHGYKTLVIDSFSKLYNMAAAAAEETVGNDYGRDKKEANKPTRQLMRWLEKIDMVVILICHYRDKWERKGKEIIKVSGTFDGWEKLEYDLDLWIEIQKVGIERSFLVKKSRITAFPDGHEFPLDYEKFCDLYGKEAIAQPSSPLTIASESQIAELNNLISIVRLDKETIEKWLTKANVDTFSEMTAAQISKCIDFMKTKLKDAQYPPKKLETTEVAA